jgi:hypothetical protein
MYLVRTVEELGSIGKEECECCKQIKSEFADGSILDVPIGNRKHLKMFR